MSLRLASAAEGFVGPQGEAVFAEAVPGGIAPFVGVADQAVLDRVAMDIADMALEIDKVADLIIPIAALPEGAVALLFRDMAAFEEAAGEAVLQVRDAAVIVCVVGWQRPDDVHMVWQDHRGDGLERVEALHIAGALGEQAGMAGEERAVAVGEVQGEEPGPLGLEKGLVRVHGAIEAKDGPAAQVAGL